jgi:hypothetical protein
MKALHTILFLLSVASIASLMQAYEYKYTNDSDFDILVGIQFGGDVGDPIYKKLVPKGSAQTFTSGTDFPSIKIGYCLKQVFYIKNPTEQQKTDPKEADWKTSKTLPVWGSKDIVSKPGEVQKYLKDLRAYDMSKKAKDWVSECASINAYIMQDSTGNIYFVVPQAYSSGPSGKLDVLDSTYKEPSKK